MDKIYQIFVSSTYEDLKDERRAVMEAIIHLRHIPVVMELFNAADESQWSIIKRRIDESDYYVVVLSDRYGTLDKDGVGFTEKEYKYAVEKRKPIIIFLRSDDAIKNLSHELRESDNKPKLKEFRYELSKRHVKYWTDENDLVKKFYPAFYELVDEKPQVGWVRADSVNAVDKEQYNTLFNENQNYVFENGSLKEEIITLKAKIQEYENGNESEWKKAKKELDDLKDITWRSGTKDHDNTKLAVMRMAIIQEVLARFISRATFSSVSEKNDFWNQPFMNSDRAFTELFAKANEVVEEMRNKEMNQQVK
ncbi:MAG: DUF4062 domain-containing protein [Candidatus Magnetominusculus sp. LBB02]|nr:DUF4062 domain-containing protein [Candidatus Magnetominusculus sp. LBB02]